MLAHIPPFVFAIFLGLLLLGWVQSRSRLVRPLRLVVVAVAMVGLSVDGVVVAFGPQALALVAWALGLVVAVVWGGRWWGPQGLEHRGSAVLVPGSWVPMALMMGIFVTKFALGTATALHWPGVQLPWLVSAISLVLGLFSGGFVARALAVRRLAELVAARGLVPPLPDSASVGLQQG